MSGEGNLTQFMVRNCDKETPEPVEGITRGELPTWLKGDLFRVGPALYQVGDTKYSHLFDGLSMIYRIRIKDGKVTYFKKFLRSDAYKANMAANRIVVSEFGTAAYPDPCKTLYQRFMSYFHFEITDNCSVNIAPYADKLYAMTESPNIREVDPESLDSPGKVDLSKYVAVHHATAHPHIDPDGTIYNMGNWYKGRFKYCIIKFPPKGTDTEGEGKTFREAEIVAAIPATWRFNPSYYHSFGITDNYFIFLEQSVVVSFVELMKARYLGKTIKDAIKWHPDRKGRFFVVEKSTGKILDQVYLTQNAVFCFHHINAFEQDGHLVIDMVLLKNGLFAQQLELNSLKNETDEVVPLFDSQPWRYILPLPTDKAKWEEKINLVSVEDTKCTAFLQKDGSLICEGEILADVHGELPRINYKYNGKKYRYCYESSTIQGTHGSPSTSGIDKIDCQNKSHISWVWNDCFAMEPVFIPSPDAVEEDDGVVLTCGLKRGNPGAMTFFVLNAKDMTVISSTEFQTEGANCLNFHGLFAGEDQKQYLY